MPIQAAQPMLGSLRANMALDAINNERQPNVGDKSFADHLQEAYSTTNAELNAGDQAARDLAAGESVGIHETMIAVERADIAFRTFTAVKNKALSAYQEIMRLQM